MERKLELALTKVQKPARYTGGELNSVMKDKNDIKLRFAFCFPDTYEIGMSHLGMKILYSLLNEESDIWCERVFAPWTDFEEQMQKYDIPLYALESHDPVSDFDMIGFTLQYEMSYTTMLRMLDLAQVPLLAEDRKELMNLVVAGGPCVCNPEPIADFVDLFMMGEGEEVILEVADLYKKAKENNESKDEFLKKAAQIDGVYVPKLYDISYNEDGTVKEIAAKENAPKTVTKRIIKDMSKVYYPKNFVVPFISTVHDRAIAEVMRGCIRGCRFCQAGFIYRPLREKDAKGVCDQCQTLLENTGYEEISLSSLSTSDYSGLEPLLNDLIDYTDEHKINMTLPSLRIDNFSKKLVEKIKSVRKSGLTFAPEAGTQRMRDVINKNISEEDVMKSCRLAFEGGYTSVKLYFMLGLPTETDEDIVGIIELAQRVVDEYYHTEGRAKGRAVNVTVSVSTFVPKPYTPFEFEPQDTTEEINRKHRLLADSISSKKISLKYHETHTSVLEGVLARGDRRLGKVILNAYNKGCYLDSWDECFKYNKWIEAFDECNVDMSFYANRKREYDEIMPWQHLDCGVTRKFLIRENKKAHEAVTTPNCREKCSGCGITKLKGGKCFE